MSNLYEINIKKIRFRSKVFSLEKFGFKRKDNYENITADGSIICLIIFPVYLHFDERIMEYDLWFHFEFHYHSLLKYSSRKKKNESKAKKRALAKKIK